MKHENSRFTRAKAQQYLEMLNKNTLYNLDDCYKNYSAKKCSAYACCRIMQDMMNGSMGTICGHTQQFFTYCFMCKIDGKDSIAIITKDYHRYIFIDEVI